MTDRTAAAIEPFTIDGSPPVNGLVLRHLRMPDDASAMNAIANATRAAEGDNFYTTDEQFALFYRDPPGSDASRDVAIAEVDGRIVGYGRVATHEEPAGPRIYEVLPFNEQTADGDAIFMALVGTLETRARTLAADHPEGDKLFETFGGDKVAGRDARLRALGYEPVRHGYAMVRPSVDALPNSPLPAGLEIREVLPEHMPAIWEAADEAFHDAWGYRPPNDSEYELFLTDPVTDTSLWRVAWDGDQVAGQVRSYINAEENEKFGRQRGYTENISVRRPWRRRGLARALIAASFPLLRARGMTEAALGVDTENVTGALRVYEGCGFVPVSRSTVYRKPLV